MRALIGLRNENLAEIYSLIACALVMYTCYVSLVPIEVVLSNFCLSFGLVYYGLELKLNIRDDQEAQ